MRWIGHVVHMEKQNADKDLVSNLKERDHLEDSDLDGTTLKWVSKEAVSKGVGWIHLAHDRDQTHL
jgi:hypothetical protein